MQSILILLACVMVVFGCDGPTVFKKTPYDSERYKILPTSKTVSEMQADGESILINGQPFNQPLPGHLGVTRYHEFPLGGCPENTELTFACCEEGGCKFYLVFYHCPGCSTPINGHLNELAEGEDSPWTPTSCSPRFKDAFWGRHPTLTMVLEMDRYGAEEVVVNTQDRPVHFVGVFSAPLRDCMPISCPNNPMPYGTGGDGDHCSHHCCGEMHPKPYP